MQSISNAEASCSKNNYNYSTLFSSGLRVISRRQPAPTPHTVPWPRDASTAAKSPPSSPPSSSFPYARSRSASLSYWKTFLTSRLFVRSTGNSTTTTTSSWTDKSHVPPLPNAIDEKALKTARRRTLPCGALSREGVQFDQWTPQKSTLKDIVASDDDASSVYSVNSNDEKSVPLEPIATPFSWAPMPPSSKEILVFQDSPSVTASRPSRPRPTSLPLFPSASVPYFASHPYRTPSLTQSKSELNADLVLDSCTDTGVEADVDDDSSLSDEANFSDSSSEEWDVDELVDAVGSGAADADSDTLADDSDGEDWRQFHAEWMGL